MIVLDTDFVSVLAKAEIIGLVKKLFSGKHDLIITPKVYEELNVPKEHGYTYPDEIFKNIGVLTAESEEQERYMELLAGNPTLGRGELESIAICMNRSAIFATLDEKAKRFAKNRCATGQILQRMRSGKLGNDFIARSEDALASLDEIYQPGRLMPGRK